MKYLFLVLICICLFGACSEVTPPKPMGYFRITLPEHTYVGFADADVPYAFEYSSFAQVVPDKTLNAPPYWINIVYPQQRCQLHVTYMKVNTDMEAEAFEDSHRLAYKHTVMADAIAETYYDNADAHVYATKYDIKGNAATPFQIAITDSAGQFFRGSLYFDCHPNKDSLAPVIDYIDKDLTHLVETFRWTKNAVK